MFGNAIQQTSSPGGIRRGMIWQSSSADIKEYRRVLCYDNFYSYGGDSNYLYIPGFTVGDNLSISYEDKSIKVVNSGFFTITTYYKPIRIPDLGKFQDVWCYYDSGLDCWILEGLMRYSDAGGLDMLPSTSSGYIIKAGDYPTWAPSGVTGLSMQFYPGSQVDIDGYYLKWTYQHQWFSEKGVEYRCTPPDKVYLTRDYINLFPAPTIYDSDKSLYYYVPPQSDIDVVVCGGLTFNTQYFLYTPPTPVQKVYNLSDKFIVHKSHTKLLGYNP